MICKHCDDIYTPTKDTLADCCPECREEIENGKIPPPTSLGNNAAWDKLAKRQKEKNHWG